MAISGGQWFSVTNSIVEGSTALKSGTVVLVVEPLCAEAC